MAFEEIFNPGSTYLKDQREADKVMPPSLAVPAPLWNKPESPFVIPDPIELQPFRPEDGEPEPETEP